MSEKEHGKLTQKSRPISKSNRYTCCLVVKGEKLNNFFINYYYYIKYSALSRFRALIKVIISHVRLFMIISHVKIIAFQISLFCTNYRFSKTVLYIINRKIHGCLEIPDLFLVLNMISHSFAALTREISCSTLEINLVFPRTHVLFSIYYIL